MMIDEQASIRSIVEALKISNVNEVAKQIDGISKDPLAGALNEAGYKYSSAKPRGWHYVGEGVEPLDNSIFDYVKRTSSTKKISSPRVHTSITDSNTDIIPSNTQVTEVSHVVHHQFTSDEVSMIKEMLRSWQEAVPTAVEEVEESVHNRIKRLPQGDKTRKTVVIDKDIGKQLDDFCKVERVNKSDVLHLALMDFLDGENL
ncbi:hypothetical protein MKY34_03985 [Sporosarcina sp. FSL K6-1522]|uniref:hypothetical protein n=1 Tax=Sporosarcina sp. FSL K6-1522 TaxID=2921554 RepID=UPI00315A9E33